MPIGKGSLQRAAGAEPKAEPKKTVKKAVKTDPAKLAEKAEEGKTTVRKPAAKKTPAAQAAPAVPETAPVPEVPAVTASVIAAPEGGQQVISHLYCELPVYLL